MSAIPANARSQEPIASFRENRLYPCLKVTCVTVTVACLAGAFFSSNYFINHFTPVKTHLDTGRAILMQFALLCMDRGIYGTRPLFLRENRPLSEASMLTVMFATSTAAVWGIRKAMYPDVAPNNTKPSKLCQALPVWKNCVQSVCKRPIFEGNVHNYSFILFFCHSLIFL